MFSLHLKRAKTVPDLNLTAIFLTAVTMCSNTPLPAFLPHLEQTSCVIGVEDLITQL